MSANEYNCFYFVCGIYPIKRIFLHIAALTTVKPVHHVFRIPAKERTWLEKQYCVMIRNFFWWNETSLNICSNEGTWRNKTVVEVYHVKFKFNILNTCVTKRRENNEGYWNICTLYKNKRVWFCRTGNES